MPTDNTTAPRDAPPERGERDELSTSHLATKNNAVNSLAGIISCISFALGIVWIFLFPLVTVTTGEAKPRGTFFDENAMLVHHTFMEMQPEDVDWALPGQLKISHDQVDANGATWLCGVLHALDLPCYTHTFYDKPTERSGLRKSVYTILEPAPGADGKESMVLTTGQNLSGSAEQLLNSPSFMGITVSLSILKRLQRDVGWMSKRLILLVVDKSADNAYRGSLNLGIKSYIDDYHLNTLDLLDRYHVDPNMTRSLHHGGVLRAGISLDLTGPCPSEEVELLTSGFNGELPNMDLVTASIHHMERQGIGVVLDRCTGLSSESPNCLPTSSVRLFASDRRRTAIAGYLERLLGMFGFMGSMVIGPSGPHAHFLQHSVDALTIRGRGQSGHENLDGSACSRSPLGVTGAILTIIRSISNLEEELHHSFFAYVMLSTRSFVSIGEYAYALVLLLLPLAIQARGLVSLYNERNLSSALLTVGAFQLFGGFLLVGTHFWEKLAPENPSLYILGATITGYFLVIGMRLLLSVSEVRYTWEGPKTVVACLVGYFNAVTALFNWPIATLLTLTHVPMLTMARPFQAKSVRSWCVLFAMVSSCPLLWAPLLSLVTGGDSGLTVISMWIRWYRLSGLMNVLLLCVVSIPAHLTVALILISPLGSGRKL